MARAPPVIAKNSLGVSRQKVSEESRSRQKPAWMTASQGKGRGLASPAAAPRVRLCFSFRAAEGGGQKIGDHRGMACNATLGGRHRHVLIGKRVAGATQARTDDPDHVGGLHAPGREAFSECGEIIGLKGGFEFGQRPERQAKNAPFAVDQRLDLAAMAVRPPIT